MEIPRRIPQIGGGEGGAEQLLAQYSSCACALEHSCSEKAACRGLPTASGWF